jgi:DNA polymerase-3 subunit delta'
MTRPRASAPRQPAGPDEGEPRIPHPRETLRLEGHKANAAAFAGALAQGKLHHAWLLTGASGIGKATFAYRAARYLLSGMPQGQPAALDTPASHPAVRQIAQGAHPALHVLERSAKRASGAIAVDDVRGLITFLQLTSPTPYRVVIVDSADDLTGGAANALLKAIEEPPKGTVFFLVSAVAGGVLPTIRSRCVKLQFRPLSDADLAAAVASACRSGGIPEPDARTLAETASLAGGSPGKALALLASGGLDLARDMRALFASLPRLDLRRMHGVIATATAKTGASRFETACDLIEERLEAMLHENLQSGENLPHPVLPLARIPELWENMRVRRRDMDALNLDKAAFLFQTFMEIASGVRVNSSLPR